jgi:hypothetical protein
MDYRRGDAHDSGLSHFLRHTRKSDVRRGDHSGNKGYPINKFDDYHCLRSHLAHLGRTPYERLKKRGEAMLNAMCCVDQW